LIYPSETGLIGFGYGGLATIDAAMQVVAHGRWSSLQIDGG